MKEKFMVRCNSSFGKSYLKEVDGAPITIEGFEFMELFIYQHDGSFGLGNEKGKRIVTPRKAKGKFVVAESRTGAYISPPCSNPEEAYFKVKKKLKKVGQGRALEGFMKKLAENAEKQRIGAEDDQ